MRSALIFAIWSLMLPVARRSSHSDGLARGGEDRGADGVFAGRSRRPPVRQFGWSGGSARKYIPPAPPVLTIFRTSVLQAFDQRDLESDPGLVRRRGATCRSKTISPFRIDLDAVIRAKRERRGVRSSGL